MSLRNATALSLIFTLGACSHGEEPPPYPLADGDLYQTSPGYKTQRTEMQCTAENKPFKLSDSPASLAIDKAHLFSQGATALPTRHLFFFDPNRTEPNSPDYAIRKLAKPFADNKEIGFRLTACNDPTGSLDYNYKLAKERIMTIAQYFEEAGIHPDRICQVPKVNCYSDERYVSVEAFYLEYR